MRNRTYFLVISILFISFLLFLEKSSVAENFLSRYLSVKYGTRIEVSQVRLSGWGKASFRDLHVGGKKGYSSWVSADSGKVYFKDFPFSIARIQVDLEGLSLGSILQKKAAIFTNWFSVDGSPNTGSDREDGSAWSRFDSAHFLIRRQKENLTVRVMAAKSHDLRLDGGAKFKHDQLTKTNMRWLFSGSIYSKWPNAIVKKMMVEKNGWRAAGLAYGGNTWELRGRRGPLLQLSGNLMANNY